MVPAGGDDDLLRAGLVRRGKLTELTMHVQKGQRRRLRDPFLTSLLRARQLVST